MSGQLCTARADGYWWNGGTRLSLYTTSSGDGFVLGTTKPTAANTGLGVLGLSAGDLTVINGDFTLDDSYVSAHAVGGVIDRLYVKGFLNFTASTTTTLTNSRIEGRTFTGKAPQEFVVRARNYSSGALLNLTNCEVTLVQPDVGISTIGGERLGSLYRCDISMGSDLIDYWDCRNDVSVRGCFIHDYTFWANDPQRVNDPVHPGWAHTDGIQISGSTKTITIEGNHFQHYAAQVADYDALIANPTYTNAAYGGVIIMTPTVNINGVAIDNNWIHGGDAQVHLATQSGGSFNTGNGFTASGNRHGYNSHPWGPYGGNYSRQFYAWDAGMMPSNTGIVTGATWDTTADVPAALRGTPMPAVTFSSGANQYQCSYQTPTPDLP